MPYRGCTWGNMPYFRRTFHRLIYIHITKATCIKSGMALEIMMPEKCNHFASPAAIFF